MATYRLDTDERGEVVFIEEENGTFQKPAPRAPWERDPKPARDRNGDFRDSGIGFAA